MQKKKWLKISLKISKNFFNFLLQTARECKFKKKMNTVKKKKRAIFYFSKNLRLRHPYRLLFLFFFSFFSEFHSQGLIFKFQCPSRYTNENQQVKKKDCNREEKKNKPKNRKFLFKILKRGCLKTCNSF